MARTTASRPARASQVPSGWRTYQLDPSDSHLALPGDALPLLVHAIVYAGIGLGAVYFDRAAFDIELPSWNALLGRRKPRLGASRDAS